MTNNGTRWQHEQKASINRGSQHSMYVHNADETWTCMADVTQEQGVRTSPRPLCGRMEGGNERQKNWIVRQDHSIKLDKAGSKLNDRDKKEIGRKYKNHEKITMEQPQTGFTWNALFGNDYLRCCKQGRKVESRNCRRTECGRAIRWINPIVIALRYLGLG